MCYLTTFRIGLNNLLTLILLYNWGINHFSWVHLISTEILTSQKNFSILENNNLEKTLCKPCYFSFSDTGLPKRDSGWRQVNALLVWIVFESISFSCCFWYKIMRWINDSNIICPLQKLTGSISCASMHTWIAEVTEGSRPGVPDPCKQLSPGSFIVFSVLDGTLDILHSLLLPCTFSNLIFSRKMLINLSICAGPSVSTSHPFGINSQL